MKPKHKANMETVIKGQPFKYVLQDGSTIRFTREGKDHYKMILAEKDGTIKAEHDLNKSGLEFMFQRFSDKD